MNDVVLQDMVDSVPLRASEAVLEIGPGIGNLTELLLARAGQSGNFVLSVEKDPKFAPLLRALKKQHKNFRWDIADILEFDFQRALQEWVGEENFRKSARNKNNEAAADGEQARDVPLVYHAVANIPYYITGKIIQLLVRARKKPKTITLLVQKEVAQNIIAKPGNLNLLAISVQLFGEVKLLQKVLARDFYPVPKVDSAVVQIILDKTPRYDFAELGADSAAGEKKFFRVLHACFAGKRKQIHNTLVNNLRLDKGTVLELLARLKIPAQARPQELSIEQWVKLVKAIPETS